MWKLIKWLKIKLCWFLNSQQSVTKVTPRWSDTGFEDSSQFQYGNQSYVFSTWLCCCQTLGIYQMVWCLKKGRVKSQYIFSIVTSNRLQEHTTLMMDVEKVWQRHHMMLVIDKSQDRIESCSRFSNSNENHDKNHLSSDYHHQVR